MAPTATTHHRFCVDRLVVWTDLISGDRLHEFNFDWQTGGGGCSCICTSFIVTFCYRLSRVGASMLPVQDWNNLKNTWTWLHQLKTFTFDFADRFCFCVLVVIREKFICTPRSLRVRDMGDLCGYKRNRSSFVNRRQQQKLSSQKDKYRQTWIEKQHFRSRK